MPPSRLCAVSVDLDEIPNYHAIHGLKPPGATSADAVYRVALARLDRFAREQDIPVTLFAIGADLTEEGAAALKSMLERGHEVGNHTLDHRYDLSRLPHEEIRRQVVGGADAIERAVGVRPQGFRAPGYVINEAVVEAIEASGATYDSSVFPCAPYYAAKAAAMAAMALRGRKSRSVLDHPRVVSAPRQPYRLGARYNQCGEGLVELPVQVTRHLRLPFIGTALTLLGPTRARWLTRWVIGDALVNLELHGMDFLDVDDGLEALRAVQPDVRIPIARKLETLAGVLERLRSEGYFFLRLDEAARSFR